MSDIARQRRQAIDWVRPRRGGPPGPFGPAIAQSNRPVFTHGVQSGDVTTNSGMIWARADRPSRLMVEVATSDSFKDARRLRGPASKS